MEKQLSVRHLSVRYGKFEAVREVDLDIRRGEILALVGPNGAGKSTTVRAIAGLLKPSRGQVTIDAQDITDLTPERRVDLHLSFVPEDRGIFQGLTVEENLRLGARRGCAKNVAGLDTAAIHSLFPVLAQRQTQAAGSLSGGEQQQLAIARALLTRPSYLVIDEPSLGLAPLVITTVYEALCRIRDEFGLGILVVEQSPRRVRRYADRVLIVRHGVCHGEHAFSADTDFAQLERAYFGLG